MKSKNFDKVQNYYNKQLWTAEMVQNAVGKWITQEEANKIIDNTVKE